MRRKQRLEQVYKAMIDDLERELFPFQESEEEQESFTPQGRQRVAEWIDRVLYGRITPGTARPAGEQP